MLEAHSHAGAINPPTGNQNPAITQEAIQTLGRHPQGAKTTEPNAIAVNRFESLLSDDGTEMTKHGEKPTPNSPFGGRFAQTNGRKTESEIPSPFSLSTTKGHLGEQTRPHSSVFGHTDKRFGFDSHPFSDTSTATLKTAKNLPLSTSSLFGDITTYKLRGDVTQQAPNKFTSLNVVVTSQDKEALKATRSPDSLDEIADKLREVAPTVHQHTVQAGQEQVSEIQKTSLLPQDRAAEVNKLINTFNREVGLRDLQSVKHGLHFNLNSESYPGTSVSLSVSAGHTVIDVQSLDPEVSQFLRDAQPEINREMGANITVRVQGREQQSGEQQQEQQDHPAEDDED